MAVAAASGGSSPVRTCVGCRARRPAAELTRWVIDDGAALTDGAGRGGRGAWLCPSVGCWDLARRRNAWARALRSTAVVITDATQAWVTEGFRDVVTAD